MKDESNSVPAPYNHSNIDSDEVIYYVDGDFMSRNDINKGSITLHPAGIPHGPHPGAMEKSIGKKETLELAVMVDTFSPLMVTEEAVKITEGSYHTMCKKSCCSIKLLTVSWVPSDELSSTTRILNV